MRKRAKINADASAGARVQRSKEAVLRTTYELLTEEGFSGVSVDAVSDRSGVAKTTIYRHWPSRTALLIAACRQLGFELEMPDTGSLRGDLLKFAAFVGTQLHTGPWASALPGVIDAAERDPELRNLLSAMHHEHKTILSTLIDRAQKRGEFPPRRDIAEMAASFFGPLFYRRWFSREPFTKRFLKHVVDATIGGKTATKKTN